MRLAMRQQLGVSSGGSVHRSTQLQGHVQHPPFRQRVRARAPLVPTCAQAQQSATKTQRKPGEVPRELADKCINTIRFLAVDAVNKAGSGHPGAPMGLAPLGYLLFTEFMRLNPNNAHWYNRDRFVLSNGHASVLQYSLLHLLGYPDMTMDDLKQLRQWGSRTPGHPEHYTGTSTGIEVTTGPLGQGIASAVGLAAAEAHMAARYNKPDAPRIVDHYTYCFMGDGCAMEGVQFEAVSLAGVWGLGKLIAFYDENGISIDGKTEGWLREDAAARFEALGWHVQSVHDGDHDLDGMRNAIEKARQVTDRPSLIKVNTTIGFGSPKLAGTAKSHGSALGEEEGKATREKLHWDLPPFSVPQDALEVFRGAVPRGAQLEEEWEAALGQYKKQYPKEYAEFNQLIKTDLPEGWEKALPTFKQEDAKATRQHSQTVLQALGPAIPGLLGGSADLASSNNTSVKGWSDFGAGSYEGRTIHFGVREHGMGAICNGLFAHNSGLIPFCATFLIFTDYMRASMRLAALMRAGVIYIMTHDSIGLGGDGPTHQPIEHLASLRAMPNMLVMRPAGGNEVSGAYKVALLNRKRPTTIALSRQKMPTLPGSSIEGVEKGAYVIRDFAKDGAKPDVILIGTGSELELAWKAGEQLDKEGIKARVVSMPCWEVFQEQDAKYQDEVLPPDVLPRVSVEAASAFGWCRWIMARGRHIGIDRFGESAEGDVLYEKFHITADAVVKAAKEVIDDRKKK